MLTFEKFSIAPVKIRVLYIKKLLNTLGFNLNETFLEDKHYKKSLKRFQHDNNFSENCIVNKDVFNCLIKHVKDYEIIWKNMK